MDPGGQILILSQFFGAAGTFPCYRMALAPKILILWTAHKRNSTQAGSLAAASQPFPDRTRLMSRRQGRHFASPVRRRTPPSWPAPDGAVQRSSDKRRRRTPAPLVLPGTCRLQIGSPGPRSGREARRSMMGPFGVPPVVFVASEQFHETLGNQMRTRDCASYYN